MGRKWGGLFPNILKKFDYSEHPSGHQGEVFLDLMINIDYCSVTAMKD